MDENFKLNLILEYLHKNRFASINIAMLPFEIPEIKNIKLCNKLSEDGYVKITSTLGGVMIKITEKGSLFIMNGGYSSSSLLDSFLKSFTKRYNITKSKNTEIKTGTWSIIIAAIGIVVYIIVSIIALCLEHC